MKQQLALAYPTGWVNKFLKLEPQFKTYLRKHLIFDDRSYLASEAELPFHIRRSMGIFRVVEKVKGETNDPCKIAMASPPWFLARKFDTIALPIRIVNVFRKSEIETVANLAATSFERLLNAHNFGTTSAGHLLQALRMALDEGPV